MASALASLHGQGMVHMDVKPANIMVGDDGAFKLGDFGLAARLDGNGGSIMEGDSRCGAGLAADPARVLGSGTGQTSTACKPRVRQRQGRCSFLYRAPCDCGLLVRLSWVSAQICRTRGA